MRNDISVNMETRNHNEANSPRRDEIGSPQSDCDMLRLLCLSFVVCCVCRFVVALICSVARLLHGPSTVRIDRAGMLRFSVVGNIAFTELRKSLFSLVSVPLFITSSRSGRRHARWPRGWR